VMELVERKTLAAQLLAGWSPDRRRLQLPTTRGRPRDGA
jgi:hypothetical protein